MIASSEAVAGYDAHAVQGAVIRATDLTKRYAKTLALDHASFEVQSGRIVGLIGPNGAGKTTALKAMLGLTDFEGELSVLAWIRAGNARR